MYIFASVYNLDLKKIWNTQKILSKAAKYEVEKKSKQKRKKYINNALKD